MKYRTLSLCLGMFGALVLSSGFQTGAASRLTEDFADLVKRASIVVEVDVGTCQDEANAQVGMPLTVASAKVLRVLRGDIANAIEIERFGGKQGDAMMIVPGQATLSAGDRAVLLLIPSPLNNGRYRVLGGDAGCVLSENIEGGERRLRRAVGRFDYYVADESSQTGFVARQASALPDDEFNALTSALIKTGRPVLTSAAPTPAKILAQTASIPVLPVTNASKAPAPTEVPLYFKLGIFVACVTLAWGTTRLTRALAK